MQNPPDAIAVMQAQALDAMRACQAATVETVKSWNATVAKGGPIPGATAPGTRDIPTQLKEMMGDPSTIVDSVYHFERQLLDLNKQFMHQLLEASRPK